MPRKANTPTVGSGDAEANANPNADTELDESQVDAAIENLDEQDQVADSGEGTHTTEAQETAVAPTQTVPAGSADASADASADSPHNGTENTHPQSPAHEFDLDADEKSALIEEYGTNGVTVAGLAAKYEVTPEYIEAVVAEHYAAKAEAARE